MVVDVYLYHQSATIVERIKGRRMGRATLVAGLINAAGFAAFAIDLLAIEVTFCLVHISLLLAARIRVRAFVRNLTSVARLDLIP